MVSIKWKLSSLLLKAILISSLWAPIASAHSVKLSWNPSPDKTVEGYFIFRSDTSGGENPIAPLNDTNSTGVAGGCTDQSNCTFVDSSVQAGHTYYYYVIAFNGSDSVPSNEIKVIVPVSAPTGLVIINSN